MFIPASPPAERQAGWPSLVFIAPPPGTWPSFHPGWVCQDTVSLRSVGISHDFLSAPRPVTDINICLLASLSSEFITVQLKNLREVSCEYSGIREEDDFFLAKVSRPQVYQHGGLGD